MPRNVISTRPPAGSHLTPSKTRAMLTSRRIKAIYQRAEEVPMLMIKAELEQRGTLGRVGGAVTLIEIMQSMDTGRPDRLAQVVAERWQLRRVMKHRRQGAAGR